MPAVEPAAATRHATFHPLAVAAVDRLTADAVAITFAVPPELADSYDFRAGQHVAVRTPRAGDAVRRVYSVCSPAGSGVLRIGVKRLPGGRFSRYAAEELRPGDVVEVLTPTGRFVLPAADGARARQHGFVAAGSGVTPVLSLLATVLASERDSRATLLLGNRTAASVMFLDELADLKDRYPARFHLVHVLSREPREVELLSGRLDPPRLRRLFDTLVPAAGIEQWYLCGPVGLVDGVRAVLAERGVDRRRVHAELFHVGAAPPAPPPPAERETEAGAPQVAIVLDGRRSSFRLPATGPPVLDAALTVRPDVPYACRAGVCGTCRARVLSGRVRMDQNHALEADELARGYVLTCQSHPDSERLVLDYDA